MPHQLDTDRLTLRPFTMADVDDAYAVLEAIPTCGNTIPVFNNSARHK
tara:strand:+ start:162 stop:305 length:144 start_codon:yes stop_codon:yes gene_type:complete